MKRGTTKAASTCKINTKDGMRRMICSLNTLDDHGGALIA